MDKETRLLVNRAHMQDAISSLQKVRIIPIEGEPSYREFHSCLRQLEEYLEDMERDFNLPL